MTEAEHASLAASMTEFGDLSGIVFNRKTGQLIGAHQRLTHLPPKAKIVLDGTRARKPNAQGTIATGHIEVDGERWTYREVEVDLTRERAMNLAANRHGGSWDYELLPAFIQALDGEIDLGLTGFTSDELDVFLAVDTGFDPGLPPANMDDFPARVDNAGGGQRLELDPTQWQTVLDAAAAMDTDPASAVYQMAAEYLASRPDPATDE